MRFEATSRASGSITFARGSSSEEWEESLETEPRRDGAAPAPSRDSPDCICTGCAVTASPIALVRRAEPGARPDRAEAELALA